MSPYVMSLLADEKLRELHADADRARLLGRVERRRRVHPGGAPRGHVGTVAGSHESGAAVQCGCA